MKYNRRQFITHSSAALLAMTSQAGLGAQQKLFRIGLTPVILDDRTQFLNQLRHWLELRLQMPVAFIQRPRYRDITELLLDGTLDAAWICGYPFVQNQAKFRLLALPVYKDQSIYNSLIIAGQQLEDVDTINDLKGKTFSFSDPDSNSGFLYPVFRLRNELKQNSHFFKRSFYSWGHKNTIEAVAVGLADGGAVDSYVWEVLANNNPAYFKAVKIIERSPDFGFPPLVTHKNLNEAFYQNLKSVVLSMHEDEVGKFLLKKLSLDGFVEGSPENYSSIAQMMNSVNTLGIEKSI